MILTGFMWVMKNLKKQVTYFIKSAVEKVMKVKKLTKFMERSWKKWHLGIIWHVLVHLLKFIPNKLYFFLLSLLLFFSYSYIL